MRSATVWLLDVDGVLNAARPGWGGPPSRGHATAGGEAFRIRWAPKLVRRIRDLHESGLVEINWCTTWCPDAHEIERLLELPRFDRAWNDPRHGFEAWQAKFDAARAVLARGLRLVWTDDEVVPTSGPDHEELTADGRALLISPVPRRGLQPEHLDQIEAFLRADHPQRSL